MAEKCPMCNGLRGWNTEYLQGKEWEVCFNCKGKGYLETKGENMDKLTKEWLHGTSERSYTARSAFIETVVWPAIEADREAIRAEVREEVLKDHYANGERVEVMDESGQWVNGMFKALPTSKLEVRLCPKVRRPPKMKPMSTVEMANEMVIHYETNNMVVNLEGGISWSWIKLAMELASGRSLVDLCKEAGLPTEVPE